jgi:hypothetical protein
MSEEQLAELKTAIKILDGIMEQTPSRKLADLINGLQEIAEGKL